MPGQTALCLVAGRVGVRRWGGRWRCRHNRFDYLVRFHPPQRPPWSVEWGV